MLKNSMSVCTSYAVEQEYMSLWYISLHGRGESTSPPLGRTASDMLPHFHPSRTTPFVHPESDLSCMSRKTSSLLLLRSCQLFESSLRAMGLDHGLPTSLLHSATTSTALEWGPRAPPLPWTLLKGLKTRFLYFPDNGGGLPCCPRP